MATRRLTYVVLSLTLASGFFTLQAAEQPLEYDVKAAFLLNFTKFIEWPTSAFSSADAPFAICIFGHDPYGRAIDDLILGEHVGRHSIVVRRIAQPPAPRTCQIIFLEAPSKIPSGLGPVLTVGEGPQFLRDGGMIAFVLENRRVRFEINEAAAAAAGLKLSSKLLSVAKSVKE